MKTRQGFVSNSSSCAFVILGFHTESAQEFFNIENKYENAKDNGEIINLEGEGYIIGESLATIYTDSPSLKDFDLFELQEKAQKISQEFNVPIRDIKIWIGTERY